jgi:hypothetical protein
MLFTETKTNKDDYKWKYKNQDLYGESTIWSKSKLDKETLDEIMFMIVDKKIAKGHTDGLKFEAKYRTQWESEEEKQARKEKQEREVDKIIERVKRERKINRFKKIALISLIVLTAYIIIKITL